MYFPIENGGLSITNSAEFLKFKCRKDVKSPKMSSGKLAASIFASGMGFSTPFRVFRTRMGWFFESQSFQNVENLVNQDTPFFLAPEVYSTL